MRILIVSHYFEAHGGGIEIVAARLAAELARQGHDVRWAASATNDMPDIPSVLGVSLPVWNMIEAAIGLPMPILRPAGLRRLIREVQSADAVIVHDALYTMSLAALLAARRYRKPATLVQHIGAVPYSNPVLRLAMRAAERLIVAPALARADQVVFISETVRRRFAGLCLRRPALTLFNGVELGFAVLAEDERAEVRLRMGLAPHRPAALFVGRFVEKKGLAHIREAARLRPDVDFLLAGSGPIEPDRWRLRNVRCLGTLKREALGEVYGAADILILPSVGEGLPLVMQEALACGLPVICGEDTAAADAAAAPWLTPIRVDPSDPSSTGERLSAVIATSPRRASADADARSAFARQRYSWDRTARCYAATLQRLMDGAPLPASHSQQQMEAA